MTARSRSSEEPRLFADLPLQKETPADKALDRSPKRPPRVKTEQETDVLAELLPLFGESDGERSSAAKEPASPRPQDPPASTRPATRPRYRSVVPFTTHLLASLMDLAAVLGAVLLTWLGLLWMGVSMSAMIVLPLLFFVVPFSFLYLVFPLAFWGHTPGMARVGIVARNRDGGSLSVSQAALRWVASALTLLGLGLPMLVTASTGRSLADRFSGSQTSTAR